MTTVELLCDGHWQAEAKEGNLADAIVDYVRIYDWVTLVELQRKFEPFMPVRGERALTLDDDNVVLWGGMSPELADLVLRLLDERRIYLHPASWLTYFIDGGVSKLPLAKGNPKGGYKRDHWLPVCLRVVPLPQKHRRTGRRETP